MKRDAITQRFLIKMVSVQLNLKVNLAELGGWKQKVKHLNCFSKSEIFQKTFIIKLWASYVNGDKWKFLSSSSANQMSFFGRADQWIWYSIHYLVRRLLWLFYKYGYRCNLTHPPFLLARPSTHMADSDFGKLNFTSETMISGRIFWTAQNQADRNASWRKKLNNYKMFI